MGEMKVGKTSRGFGLINFKDKYGQGCSLQKSSLAMENCVWFGVDERMNLNTQELLEDSDNMRMHLTQDQVAALIPHLQHFVDTGYLPEQELSDEEMEESIPE